MIAVAFAVLCLVWGLAFVVFRVAVTVLPPITFSAARAIVSGVVPTVAMLAFGSSVPRDRATHVTALLLGLTNIAAFWALQNLAITRITAGETAILVYLQPLLVGIGAWAFLEESLTARKILGLVLGFLGIVVVLARQVGSPSPENLLGYALAAAAGLAWATGTIIYKRRGWKGSPLWMAALQSLYGAVPLTLLAGLLEHPTRSISFTTVWTVVYASLAAAVLAYWLWYSLLRQRSATQVAAFVFLVPVVAVAGDALFLGNVLGPTALAGGLLVVAGIWLVNGGSFPRTPPHP